MAIASATAIRLLDHIRAGSQARARRDDLGSGAGASCANVSLSQPCLSQARLHRFHAPVSMELRGACCAFQASGNASRNHKSDRPDKARMSVLAVASVTTRPRCGGPAEHWKAGLALADFRLGCGRTPPDTSPCPSYTFAPIPTPAPTYVHIAQSSGNFHSCSMRGKAKRGFSHRSERTCLAVDSG